MLRQLILAVTLVLYAAPAAADGPFDDFGYELSRADLEEIRIWHNQLPAVGDAGQAFVGCSASRNSSPQRFDSHFEICWTLPNQNASCSHRCGAAYNVYGFWAPNAANPDAIDYAIFCRCNQIRHWYDQYPVPQILVDLGVAD